MTGQEGRGSMVKKAEPTDEFPVGMRVFAVDDDPICLKLLENLLLRCRYNVTTTSQAIVALQLLRENKDKFDLVISDVHMPDMDGFKLLELVGLEMDLPVIMMSANDDTKAVMKGITHGACDYLLKPIRIEEVRNIWQHVVRRKKFDTRYHNAQQNSPKTQLPTSESTKGMGDPSGKLNRKRKDQNEEEDEDSEENFRENEDPSTQKKPRVVWSVELHGKFVAAVNQLGIDQAVPKKILDLMNVEKLTRENVASHLQKYRLYLKRLSTMANQPTNMATILGGRNISYNTSSLDGFRNFNALGGSRQLPALTSFQPNGLPGGMNSSTAVGMHGLVPSQIVQLGHTHNTSNVINDLWKLQGNSLLVNHQGNSLLGMPTSMGLDHMHKPKVVQEANNIFLSGFSGSGLVNELCNNSFADMTNNPLSVEANREQTQAGGLGKYSSVGMPYSSLDPFENCLGESSQSPDLVRCNDTWQDANPLTDYCASTLPICAPLSSNCSSPSNIGGSVCSIVSNMDGAICGQSSIHVAVAPMHDSEIVNGVHGHVGSLGGGMLPIPMDADEDPKFSNFGSLDKSKQKWEEHKQNHGFNPNVIFSASLNSSLPNLHINVPTANQILSSTVGNKKMDTVVTGGTTLDTLDLTSNCSINKSTANGQLTHKGEYALETTESHCGIPSADCRCNEHVDGEQNASNNRSST